MKELNIGVLGLQGAIEEHIAATNLALNEMGLEGKVLGVKTPKEVGTIDGLIMPGGETTVIGGLSILNQAFAEVKQRISGGMPVLGTCAGMILLAKRTFDRVAGETEQPILGLMDIVVERNAYGRQRESFEVDLDIPVFGGREYRGVFIRSPAIRETGPQVEVLCRLNNVAVAVRQDTMIGTAFHPELTADTRLHQLFVKAVVQQIGTGRTASY